MKKLHVCLCSECAQDLKTYNPYVDESGKPLSLDEIEVEEVIREKCKNYTDATGRFVNNETASYYLG